MMDVTRDQLNKGNTAISSKRDALEGLIKPVMAHSDAIKVHAILAIVKTIDDPAVAEGLMHASSVMNGKGLALRARTKEVFADGSFGILPRVVGVVG